MNSDKLNAIEATFLVIIVTLAHIILNLPNTILSSVGSSAIINVLYISFLIFIFFLIVNKLFSSFPGKDILDVSEYVGGKTLKIITNILYTLSLTFTCGILILDFSEMLKLIYFPDAVVPFIVGIFLLTAVIVNKIGFKNVVKVNTLIVFVVLIAVVIVFAASFSHVDFQRIFPIMGKGINETFFSGILNIYAFAGLIYLYLIKPNLRNEKDYKKVGIASIILSSLYLLLSVASLLFLFPFLTTGTETLSVYMSTRAIKLGKFFERTDALFILVWIFAFLSYLSVIISYLTKINKKVWNAKHSSPIIYIIALLTLIATLIPTNSTQIRFIEDHIYKYLSLFLVFGYSFVILLIGYFKKNNYMAKRRKTRKSIIKINN